MFAPLPVALLSLAAVLFAYAAYGYARLWLERRLESAYHDGWNAHADYLFANSDVVEPEDDGLPF